MQNGKPPAAAGAALIAASALIAIKAHKDLRIAASIAGFGRHLQIASRQVWRFRVNSRSRVGRRPASRGISAPPLGQ
jgi:hypothetical protein